jgi:hypothetical protein
MAKCSNCGFEGTRVRSRWTEKGAQLPDECPNCSQGSFEKFTAPSDKKIWLGYEAHPNEYVKAGDGGFDRKPEYRAEQEQKLQQETEEERDARLKAEAKKRRERRTEPMTPAEHSAAMRRAEEIARWIAEAADEGRDTLIGNVN